MPETKTPILIPMTKDLFMSLVGEGLHTGIRKGCDSPESAAAWKAISDMPDWNDALEFLAGGLELMGYFFTPVEDGNTVGRFALDDE